MEWEDLRLTEIFVLPGKAAYMQIPQESLVAFFNKTFSTCVKDPLVADIAQGKWHRWKAGHDLLIDVPKRFFNDGMQGGLKHIGHLLTDVATHDGLPFPLLSKSGLGDFLVNKCGIKIEKLCFTLNDAVNIADKGVSILCVGEGGMDIFNAFSGNMEMNFTTFCDTFGEGAFQLAFGIPTGNGLMIAAGVENIFAGLVSAWKTYTIQIDLLPFFGATLASTLIGFLTAKYICKNDMPDVIQKSVKSGMITALFHVSASFGYGAAVCCAYIEYIKYLAQRDSKQVAEVMRVDKDYYAKFLQILDSFEDKKIRDAYLQLDNYVVNKIAASGGYEALIGSKRLNVAMSALNANIDSELKQLMQGDFLVNYLERR